MRHGRRHWKESSVARNALYICVFLAVCSSALQLTEEDDEKLRQRGKAEPLPARSRGLEEVRRALAKGERAPDAAPSASGAPKPAAEKKEEEGSLSAFVGLSSTGGSASQRRPSRRPAAVGAGRQRQQAQQKRPGLEGAPRMLSSSSPLFKAASQDRSHLPTTTRSEAAMHRQELGRNTDDAPAVKSAGQASSLLEEGARVHTKARSRFFFLLPLLTGSADPVLQAHMLLVLCWFIPCLVVFCQTVLGTLESVEDEFALKKKDLEKLEDSFHEMIQDINHKVQDLVEKQLDWVQDSFNEKADDFKRFLLAVTDNPEFLGGVAADHRLAGQFGRFCLLWLEAFQECVVDPLAEPHVVVSAEEVSACDTVRGICQLLLERMKDAPVSFLSRDNGARQSDVSWPSTHDRARIDLSKGCTWLQLLWLNPFYIRSTDRLRSGDSAFPFEFNFFILKLTILSKQHLSYLSIFLFGFALSVYMVMFNVMMGCIALLGDAFILTILYNCETLDTLAELTIQHLQVARESEDVRNRQERLSNFFDKVDQLSDLWTYRTRPRLVAIKAAHAALLSSRWSDWQLAFEYLKFVNAGFEMQAEQLDGLKAWFGAKRLSEPACKLIREQLDRCGTLLRSRSAIEILESGPASFRLLNFISIRVVGCNGLGDASSSYVRLRVNDGDWLKTPPAAGAASPKWHHAGIQAEFHVNMVGSQAYVDFEVWHERRCNAFIGSCAMEFDGLQAGEWSEVTLKLEDGPAAKGSLDLEVYCADKAGQLIGVVPAVQGGGKVLGPADPDAGLQLVRPQQQRQQRQQNKTEF
eukprot:TRINITY_DN10431_c0_g1_i1.p1 TRINITY_DN10431_c0_g1~~TRINITY_DN10431_c0_g1_i1.p1  ORF type:complete len:807 (+),score=153.95 TRINITY_DN10431_c0_g1_i1:101-2521(+)